MLNARIVENIRQIFVFEFAIWLTFESRLTEQMVPSEIVKSRTLQKSIQLP
jgi:hypothetical protein